MQSKKLAGQDIIDAQCALTRAGFYAGDIDGILGPQMALALGQLQSDHKLAVTSELDVRTVQALRLPPRMIPVAAVPAITAARIATMLPATPAENIDTNLIFVLNSLKVVGLADCKMIAMALATLRTEAASFLPVSEKCGQSNTSSGAAPFNRYTNVLGNEGPADAALFRGRGFIQITGRTNYETFSKLLFADDRLVRDPLLAHDRLIAARVLAQYLKQHEAGLRIALDAGNLDAARRVVNGGANGLAAFTSTYVACLELGPDC